MRFVMRGLILKTIEKCISSKVCGISYKSHKGNYFQVSRGSETVEISFKARLVHGHLPSEIIFAQDMLKKFASHLWLIIVCVISRVTFITNEVVMSRHDCLFERFTCDLDSLKHLTNGKF